MGQPRRRYIPAAAYDWLLPLYDPLQRWLVREDSVKRPLIQGAEILPGHRVLDIGCGTATLTILIKRLHPEAEVIGLDPDPKALAIAERKCKQARVQVHFDQGFSDELPFPDASLDRVLSSFMFHHLTRDEKLQTLREVQRVLQPGGSFHLLDFGKPRSRFGLSLARLLHRGERTRDNIEGRLLFFMRDTGFSDPEETAHRGTLFGSVSYYRGAKPAAPTMAGAV